MRAWHPRLAVAFAIGCASCSLLSSLDYLQAHRDAAGLDGDGGPGSGPSNGGPADASGTCPPAEWSTCGVISVAADVTTTAISAAGDQQSVYYADEHGSVLTAKCGATCSPTSTVVTGEEPILFLGYNAVSLYWLTAAAVRRFPLYPDAGGVTTTTTVRNPHGLSTLYPNVAWADDDGVRMEGVLGSTGLHTVSTVAATAPLLTSKELLFIGAGQVQRCTIDSFPGGCSNPGALAGTDAAMFVAFAIGFADSSPIFTTGGIVATVPRDGGTSFVLAEQPDDAGVLPSIADTTDTVVAVTASVDDVYFTTTSGELRRRSRNQPGVITMLSGLGRRTYLAADQGGVFVADPEARQLLHVAR